MTPLTEAAFQKRILKACQEEDKCHAVKITRMWAVMAGLPDLYIKHPEYPPVWLELKVNHRKGPILAIELSPLQRHFIRREKAAGGYAGWAVLCQGAESWVVYAGSSSEIASVKTSHSLYADGAASKSPQFNIRKILEAVTNGRTLAWP